MASINTKHLNILRSIIEAGFKDEKQIGSIGLNEAARLPRCCRLELFSVLECTQAVKSGKLLSYLIDESATTATVPKGEENET